MSTETSRQPAAAISALRDGASELALRLASALDRASRHGEDLVAVAVSTIAVAPEALFHELEGEHRLAWLPPGGDPVIGIGAWRSYRSAGADRISDTQAAIAPALGQLSSVIADPADRPRAFAGFAFAPGAADATPWTSFGDARAIIPQWTYTIRGAEGHLLGVFDAEQLGAVTAGLGALAEAIFAAATWRGSRSSSPLLRDVDRVGAHIVGADRVSPALWSERIEAIRHKIADGECKKIVSAHQTLLSLSRTPTLGVVLANLSESHPSTTRFAFDFGDGVFIGATPERLIAKDGAVVRTEALAGTIAKDAADGVGLDAAASLIGSAKDQGEHSWVLEAITAALGPWCDELSHAATPTIRLLRDVLHLQTEILGHLQGQPHILEIVNRLHPTPAVGGYPREVALDFIASSEHNPRGWYASPVGWFDAAGDGEFVVALRSGLITDDQAYLYAGAGIVADSRADAELRETELKLQALLSAITAP